MLRGRNPVFARLHNQVLCRLASGDRERRGLHVVRRAENGIDGVKLARPLHVVQELPLIVAVVVGRVNLGVVRGREGGHLVSVHRVVEEEPLHLTDRITTFSVRHHT